MDKLFHPRQYNGDNYLSTLGLKLSHVSKKGQRTRSSFIVNADGFATQRAWILTQCSHKTMFSKMFSKWVNITTTSHDCHEVSNHRSFDCLFNSLCRPTSKKHQSPHYWPFMRGGHRWPVNSPHKGSVTRKKLPFDDVIMNTWHGFLFKYRHGIMVVDAITIGVLGKCT